jgi:predicted DNA-binding transcriptional regulator AlpA
MSKKNTENGHLGYFGNGKRLRSIKETAEFLGIKPQTLYNMRTRRQGPDYVLIGGKPMYEDDAIDRYLDANRVCLSA